MAKKTALWNNLDFWRTKDALDLPGSLKIRFNDVVTSLANAHLTVSLDSHQVSASEDGPIRG